MNAQHRVIIAHRNPLFRGALVAVLAPQLPEVTITTAADGRATLAQHKGMPADVIVIEYHLAVSAGIEMIRSLRACDQQVPIVLLTNESSADDLALNLGATTWIDSTRNLDGLIQYLRQLFNL